MASVSSYDAILQGPLKTYLQCSSKIGGDVAAHAKLVESAFNAQKEFLVTASKASAPSNSSLLQALLKPTSDGIGAIQNFRESHRGSPHFNHLSAVSESIPALGWVAVSPAPAPYVKEMNDAGQFYTNRVLKEWKEKDKVHVEWTKAWVQTLTELQQFVKQYHTTGLCWGGRGMPEGGTPAPPPPPPGPMPPPPPPIENLDISAGGVQDRSALFAEINQGEAITRSLKKVTPDMQVHKNQALRSGPAPFKAPSGDVSIKGYAPVRGPGAPSAKPPVFTRDGKKWLVEHQKNNSNLVVENAEMNNVVYMFRCEGSTLTVRGKINSVVVDSCRKSSVVFDSLVSSVEFINCQSVQMQVLGKVPTITIDKTDGCQMYLSKDSMDVEIVSSKSSEMNVMVPQPNGDYMEYPIPEQYKTTVSEKGLKTEVVECKA
ncbi:adenylyl cyclase-associated protein 1 isoform X3 [Ischnura elegans]|nr:adenylyl cyclase-associated protein 1 isoform X3 [Ischnura elegans]XP_046383910.1 adenylyl cyclase-associated protein 1 isoform X3 [Ischnura elegans]